MSHRPQYRGRAPKHQPAGPRNEIEMRRRNICQQQGFSYPPNHDIVYQTLLHMKSDAEAFLKEDNFFNAYLLYTNCVDCAQLFPEGSPAKEEHHKLLCNRSLVLTKMGRFREAENDAQTAMMLNPDFLKAYWRVSQAVRGYHDGAVKALPYILAGLQRALDGMGTTLDVIDFLRELCTLIPMTSAAGSSLYPHLLDISKVVQKIEKSQWIKVVQKLSAASSWQSVAMLMIGKHRIVADTIIYGTPLANREDPDETAPTGAVSSGSTLFANTSNHVTMSGPPSVLDGIAGGIACGGISVGSLLASTKPGDLKNWAEDLAVKLIKLGASVDEIGVKMNKPPLHVATEVALTTRKTPLLLTVLDKYKDQAAKKNAQNSVGSTALHLLVRSGQASSTHGMNMLQLLLRYDVSATVEDKNRKIPLDYLRTNEEAFRILKKATKTVEELRQDLEAAKGKGNEALKAGRLRDALRHYGDGLDISQKSKLLHKEAAILYSNRANVLYKLDNFEEALTNALAAVSCDPTYHKGHWWCGKMYAALHSYEDAFMAYMDGCNKASISPEVQVSFIQEAATLLKLVPDDKFMTCYSQLNFVNQDLWPQVVAKLSRANEWRVMAYLVLGPDLDDKRFERLEEEDKSIVDSVADLLKGVAKSALLHGVVINTVFTYLRENQVTSHMVWLDAMILIVFVRGGMEAYKTFADSDRDTPLHATIRYSLITGSLTLLLEMPVDNVVEVDGLGNSVFHTVAKQRPLPPEEHIAPVVQILIDKGFSAMYRDSDGKLAVDYLDRSYPGYVFDMFFQASGSNTLCDINQLKQEGNIFFKSGNYHNAIQSYTKAISTLERHGSHAVKQGMKNRDIAMLYGNRAEAYIKTEEFQQALEDAKKSVSVDGQWYKAHLRVGKALRGMWNHEASMKAFINAYRFAEAGEDDAIRVEIMLELCEVCLHLQRRFDLKKRLPEFPQGVGHVWARAAYKFIQDNKWDLAQVAYYQYTAGNARRKTFESSLKPLCNLKKLKTYSWGAALLQYFLECRADRHTITIESGDTYLHAVVRIELVAAGKTIKLLEYVVRQFCLGTSRDLQALDASGNTVLHTATCEMGRDINMEQRNKIIILLLKNHVDPNIRNKVGKLALDYLPLAETQSREHLRMAMYGKENMPKATAAAPNKILQRPSSEPRQTPSPKSSTTEPQELKGCDICDSLYRQATIHLSRDEVRDGYIKLKDILDQPHKYGRHERLLKNVIDVFVNKLGESVNPEIPIALVEIPKEFYLQIIEGLGQKEKWRQMDAIVRKYRAVKGSDQLKGFASSMSVVPVISDSSLRGAEDVKLQIVGNLINSGATIGTDRGVKALFAAQAEDHYKVMSRLIREEADTSRLSITHGDTPIHAALTIVLEKEKDVSLLEYLLDQYRQDPDRFSHLDPEQLDSSGDCLFHVIAKAKNNTTVNKVTELLCNRNLSAQYYNKEGKLPVHYITKRNDRRLQFLRLAGAVKPKREQKYIPKSPNKGDKSGLDDDDLQQFMRSNDAEIPQEVTEVTRVLSVFETRKRKISDMIRLLPDSKVSIFRANVEKKGAAARVIQVNAVDEDDEAEIDSKKMKMIPEKEEIGADKKNKNKSHVDVISENVNNSSQVVAEGDLDETAEEISVEASQDEESADFVDAVESLEDLSKDVLDSIDDLPMETMTKHHNIPQAEESVGNEIEKANIQADGKLSDVLDNIGSILCQYDSEAKPTLQENDEDKLEDIVSDKEPLESIETQVDEEKEVIKGDISDDETETTKVEVEGKVSILEEERPREEEGKEDEGARVEPAEDGDNVDQAAEDSDSEDDLEEEEEFVIDAQVFDNLEWEVECTAEVWKTLRDKHVTHDLKRRIVHKIQLLATGDWQPHLCKRLRNVPPNLRLYEAKFTKGSRILWELAIAFSPRCSEAAESRLQVETGETTQAVRGGRIYSEIIRVWEIVLDHDKIHRTVEKIKRSHDRGEKCIIQKNLKGIRDDLMSPTCFTEKRYPRLYAEGEETLEELQRYKKELQRYFPPASANDTEYHILKFYSFSSVLVSHILHNIETKVDFPFRVTDLEHAIIELRSKAPILLLGRSGTGKTTCCLYRLWSQFHRYWTTANKANAPLMPRSVEFMVQEVEGVDTSSESESDSDDSQEDAPSRGACRDGRRSRSSSTCAAKGNTNDDLDPDNHPDDEDVAEEVEEDPSNMCDHLHQVFITKNSVLCSEVQKNFRELSHADESMAEHVQHEDENLPTRLQDVEDYSYPLFVTSRQLLLMLDASIGGTCFFERKDDGSLKVDIAGWSDMDGPLSILPLLDEDSDAEDEAGDQYVDEEDELEEGDVRHTAAGKKKKVDPRREITYAVFVEEIWPRIKKSMHESYHPSLIWMEIMSFIKGSYEALTKPLGFLHLDEYERLGRKRAPNFSGQRDVIYSCFKRYEHFKKQNSLFDETDMVHDVFRRLRQLKVRPWVIHQIFVDETQDFTQAELCMLIRLCQNPNDMFLTGDTAQSIMRGIAFRFSDLRSLFYHAKQSMQAMGKTSAIEVPKQVYQLTHNYRSHAGILSLASSILELMVEFFPESFDRLQPDQGLFNGPRPILLESCSFSDLAVLLRGNKRKTSHIEFGAHQAILVVSDAAREAIPEELRLGLVLTIYEAKGLEFDDVLLYNFFKDSQANKEWRVVTEYLERIATQHRETKSGANTEESLVMIDEEILSQSGRPRPLNFDPNQHKVLNSELKHLYTALTRARVNVWIFDEDRDKRAPMFEFFKARKLVKSLTVSEINEESLSETVFAEKSSCQDWVRRGEDFMKHHLYQVAAKCFSIGQDTDREKVALAHHQALLASRLKDHPRRMREEFLLAAEMYLECNKPSKAAVCLQNSREKELAAELFEKLGQFERAADIYRRLKQPLASSRCYEQLGNFNKAMEVLYENESYTMALDMLSRYQMIIQDLRQKGAPIPPQLLENKPAQHFTEEKLSHRAAELFHKYRNKERMLEAVDRFKNVADKVQFLEKKEYITEAADMLQKDGQLEMAANLLLKYGKIDEAELAARKTLDEAVIARHLLASCRIRMHRKKKSAEAGYDKHLHEMVKEAIQLFQTCHNNDGFGQARLLQVELTGDTESIKQAWKSFKDSSPVYNEAGLLDCADWLVNHGNLENPTQLRHVIESTSYVFSICRVLLDSHPTTAGVERIKKLDQYYGLLPCSADKLAVHPQERPLCVTVLKDLFRSKNYRKKSLIELPTLELREALVVFLLKRTLGWVDRVITNMNWSRDHLCVCQFYQAGLECPNEGNIDRPCFCMHRPHSKEALKKLLTVDVSFIELESNLEAASQLLKKKLPPAVAAILNRYVEEGQRDMTVRFHACRQLWDDLMPAFGHPATIGPDSRGLVSYLRNNEKVVSHFRCYLTERWKEALKEQKGSGTRKRLKCMAVRQTEIFLLLEFGYHLFGLDVGKFRMTSPYDQMLALENELDAEVGRKGASEFRRSKNFYTLMIGGGSDARFSVECIAKRFTDAYGWISRKSQSDPYEAVFAFSKFIAQLSSRPDQSFFPELKHYLFWIEFYSVLAILTIAKLKSKDFQDFVFVLPSSYLDLLRYVEATLPSHSLSILDGIEWWKPEYKARNLDLKLQDRLKYFADAMCARGQRVILMREALKLSRNDPANYCLVERLLVLGMTFVCNIGKALPVVCEVSLMYILSWTDIPLEGPQRLKEAVNRIRNCRGVADVASTLQWLIKERQNGDEVLQVNRWMSGKRRKIESSPLKDVQLFSPEFLNPRTLSTMKSWGTELPPVAHLEEETMMEHEPTEEEILKGRAEKQAQIDRQRAACVITRFVRRLGQLRRKHRKIPDENATASHIDQQFAAVKVDDKWCGICGVCFEQKLEEAIKLEQSSLVGDKSVLNDQLHVPTSDDAEPVSPGAFSPEQTKHGAFQWGKPQAKIFTDPEFRQKRLHSVREEHIKDGTHLNRCIEFNRFRKKYREKTLPELNKFKSFLHHPDFNLADKDYREKNYDRYTQEIDRMFHNCAQIEREVQMLIQSRMWSNWGLIDQKVTEVWTDLNNIGSYVVEEHARLKKEEEERLQAVTASASGVSIPSSENWEDELDDYEQVVEEPKMATTRHTRRQNKNRRNRKQ